MLFVLYTLSDLPLDGHTLGALMEQHPNTVGRTLRRFRAEGIVKVSYSNCTLYQLTALGISILDTLHGQE